MNPPSLVHFNLTHGPFATYSEFLAFFNERHQTAMDAKKLPLDDPLRNDFFDLC